MKLTCSLPNLNRDTTSFSNFTSFQHPADPDDNDTTLNERPKTNDTILNKRPKTKTNDTTLNKRPKSNDTEHSETSPFKGILSTSLSSGEMNENHHRIAGSAIMMQVNLEMETRSWFPDDFSRQLAVPPIDLPPTDQPRTSSSSSSLRSLPMGSPEASPFLFNIPSITSSLLEPLSSSTSPLHQAFIQFPSIQFPTPETTETKTTETGTSQKPSAFKGFGSALGPSTMTIAAGVRKPNIQKRAITFFRNLSLMRIQGRAQGSRPMSSPQLHHISERKRREKLNESFQALRSLLPLGTKKDKASVLASMTDYLASSKAQVEELTKRSRDLEEKVQLLASKKDHDQEVSLSPDQRLDVRITHEAESTSQARVIGLQVVLRGERNVMDLVTRILEFFRRVENASLLSVEADAQVVDSNPINIVRLRLRIEGGEWDESAFQEAVRRVVADMAQ